VATQASILLALGAILGASILADALARRTRIPRISLLILVGVAVGLGRSLFAEAPEEPLLGGLGEPLTQLALVMVAFLLGGELTRARLRHLGALIAVVSAMVVLTSIIAVGGGLLALGYPLTVALSLAAVGVATDPAAVLSAVEGTGSGDSLNGRLLKGVVAVDDAWGIAVFGLVMAFLGWWTGTQGGSAAIWHAAWELGGACLLGIALGLPAAWLTGRLRQGEPTQIEAIALVLIMAGLSNRLAISGLLLAMVTGAVIANASPHHRRAFHEIEEIEWPFLVFFFVFSGARLEPTMLTAAGGITAAFIVLRLMGRYTGGWLAARAAHRRDASLSPHLGLALTPQAGVAMGMALLAAERFPAHASLLVATAVAATVVFELLGPWLVTRVLTNR
jgi:Kef-type K+ transport system membrane component KefB